MLDGYYFDCCFCHRRAVRVLKQGKLLPHRQPRFCEQVSSPLHLRQTVTAARFLLAAAPAIVRRPGRRRSSVTMTTPLTGLTRAVTATATVWQNQLPVLHAAGATLRPLRPSDAKSLLSLLTTAEVTRFISPPPSTAEGFERFIAWSLHEQACGRYICFGIVPQGCTDAFGIIQVRQLEPGFGTAEWGFAIGREYWGSGLFHATALAVMEFVFSDVGVHRLEARAAVANGRGNAALRKLGAKSEGLLRKSFLRNGEYLDQLLWAIVADDWFVARPLGAVSVH